MGWTPMPPPRAAQAAEQSGRYLTTLCRESGRSQASIAEQLGMTDVGFRKYLNNRRKTASTIYLVQYAVEAAVGAQVTRKVRREFGMKMPRT